MEFQMLKKIFEYYMLFKQKVMQIRKTLKNMTQAYGAHQQKFYHAKQYGC